MFMNSVKVTPRTQSSPRHQTNLLSFTT